MAAGDRCDAFGVARAVKTRDFLAAAPPYFYLPARQSPLRNVDLHIRTSLGPAAMRPLLVRELHAMDGSISPFELLTMREQVDRMATAQQVALTMLTVFGAMALGLAAIGLSGVMAATVAQGTRQCPYAARQMLLAVPLLAAESGTWEPCAQVIEFGPQRHDDSILVVVRPS